MRPKPPVSKARWALWCSLLAVRRCSSSTAVFTPFWFALRRSSAARRVPARGAGAESSSESRGGPCATARCASFFDFDEPAPDGGRKLLKAGKGDRPRGDDRARAARARPGATITTDACRAYMASSELPDGLEAEVAEHVRRLEVKTGKRFGDAADPLLVSVRSGAAISMPGMMDTILNLGLNDEAVEGLAARTGNRRFAFDSYRRLIQMFGEVVDGIDGHAFEDALTTLKRERGAKLDTDLTDDDDLAGARRDLPRRSTARRRAPTSRRPRPTSCCARSARFSTRGTPRARRCIAGPTTSRTTSARRSTSSRWCSATRAIAPEPAWRSRATRRPGRRRSTASSS